MPRQFFDLDSALLALEALGYEQSRTEPHLHLEPGGAIAEIVQGLGGDVDVCFSTPSPASTDRGPLSASRSPLR